MAFREVRVHEVREVLRHWVGSELGQRPIAERAGVDRKTVRRYIEAALALGVVRDGGVEQLTDELIGQVINAVRPERVGGHGQAWDRLLLVEDEIQAWVKDGLQLTNVHGKLERQGVLVPYRTLHRFAVERCRFGRKQATVRVSDGRPGMECQVDFGRLGMMFDPRIGRRRAVHALIFTAVVSRHMFVRLSFTQTLADVIAGCEAAWVYYGGVFKVLIPDNLKPVVTSTDPVNPTFSDGWLDYAQARGFGTDPARVRCPKDKPRVERVVQYVRESWFRGEQFTDLADAQRRVERWCTCTAGLRIHGTTAQRPAEHFAEAEQHLLLPAPTALYDVPVFTHPKVAPDRHAEVLRALYSIPGQLIGQRLQARADSRLVKFYYRGQLVKTHPRKPPGGRSTHAADLPEGTSDYALRDVESLRRKAALAGPSVGIYASRILDVPLPWTSMRAVYRLLGLCRSYGPAAVDTACARALELDVVDVRKIARMLEQATERQPALIPAKIVGGPARFARDNSEYRAAHPQQGTLL
ncbi:MAG: IS21 family transposase [Mycobacterium sp.]|nr:IS21 family transposase [Mycobacterium sp.]